MRLIPLVTVIGAISSGAAFMFGLATHNDILFLSAFAVFAISMPYLVIIGLSVRLCGWQYSLLRGKSRLCVPCALLQRPRVPSALAVPGHFYASGALVSWASNAEGLALFVSSQGAFMFPWDSITQVVCNGYWLWIYHESKEIRAPLVTGSAVYKLVAPYYRSKDIEQRG